MVELRKTTAHCPQMPGVIFTQYILIYKFFKVFSICMDVACVNVPNNWRRTKGRLVDQLTMNPELLYKSLKADQHLPIEKKKKYADEKSGPLNT